MPSFKDRLRPSRKYKKNKESGGSGTVVDDPINFASVTSTHMNHLPTTVASSAVPTLSNIGFTSIISNNSGTTLDDYTGSAALSSYPSVDLCE